MEAQARTVAKADGTGKKKASRQPAFSLSEAVPSAARKSRTRHNTAEKEEEWKEAAPAHNIVLVVVRVEMKTRPHGARRRHDLHGNTAGRRE